MLGGVSTDLGPAFFIAFLGLGLVRPLLLWPRPHRRLRPRLRPLSLWGEVGGGSKGTPKERKTPKPDPKTHPGGAKGTPEKPP